MNSAPSRGRLRGNGCKGDSTVAARQSSDEAISAPLHGFDVTRILRRVAQRPPQLINYRVQTVLESRQTSRRPKPRRAVARG